MGILRNAICGRTGQALNRFYLQNQLLRQGAVDKDALVSPFSSLIGNVNGISVASKTIVQSSSLVNAAKFKLSGKVFPTTIRDYATSVESNKLSYFRTMGGNPMIQRNPLHHASNVYFYSSSSSTTTTSKSQPKEKSYPTVFWHLHEGIEEIMADYVHHEVTRTWVLIFFRLSLIIIAKDVFVSLVF